MGVDNDNDAILSENVQATAIMAHPYHWDVIGWMSDIQGWRRDEIIAYYKTYYAPNNAVLILVGDFAEARALELIRKYFGPIPSGPTPPAVVTVEPPQMGPKRVFIQRDAQVPSFQAVWHAPAVHDPGSIPMDILGRVLLRGESSRLYRRLVRQEQLASSVFGGASRTIDPYLFAVHVKPKPGADLARIEAVIEAELAKIKKEGLADSEIQKVLNAVRSDFYRSLQTIAGKAYQLAETETAYGGFERMFTLMDDYAAVTNAKIIEAANQYFTDRQQDRWNARSRRRPEMKIPDEPSLPFGRGFPGRLDGRSGSAARPGKAHLEERDRRLLLEDGRSPMVSLRLYLKGAGSAQEPSAFEGIAGMTADQIMKGTFGQGR